MVVGTSGISRRCSQVSVVPVHVYMVLTGRRRVQSIPVLNILGMLRAILLRSVLHEGLSKGFLSFKVLEWRSPS